MKKLSLTLSAATLFLFSLISPVSAADIAAARNTAAAAEAALLAPTAWKAAEKARLEYQETSQTADSGITGLYDAATKAATTTAVELKPVLVLRTRAIDAGADTNDRNWQRAEKQLSSVAAAIERGSDQSRKFAALSSTYDAAELAAIKSRLLQRARSAQSLARIGDAQRLAPKTFANAQTMLAEAVTVLDNDRTATETAQAISASAETEFKHATQIAIAVSQVRSDRLTDEDVILGWEERLQVINNAAGNSYDALDSWDDVVAQLVTYIESLNNTEQGLRDELNSSRTYMSSLEEELRVMDERLGGTVAERDSLIFQQQEDLRRQEKLRLVNESFTPEEATVLRRNGDIILRLQGMKFTSGSAKLSDTAITLLARTGQIIDSFLDARITVEGHTDASGSAKLNDRLSQERADAVMRHMTKELRIDGRRINAVGYGSNQPVGLNSTPAGRAQNRRIDIVISPPEKALQ